MNTCTRPRTGAPRRTVLTALSVVASITALAAVLGAAGHLSAARNAERDRRATASAWRGWNLSSGSPSRPTRSRWCIRSACPTRRSGPDLAAPVHGAADGRRVLRGAAVLPSATRRGADVGLQDNEYASLLGARLSCPARRTPPGCAGTSTVPQLARTMRADAPAPARALGPLVALAVPVPGRSCCAHVQ